MLQKLGAWNLRYQGAGDQWIFSLAPQGQNSGAVNEEAANEEVANEEAPNEEAPNEEVEFWRLAGPRLQLADGSEFNLADCCQVEVADFNRGRGRGLTVCYTVRPGQLLAEGDRYYFRIWQPLGEEGLLAQWWFESVAKDAAKAADKGSNQGAAAAFPVKRLLWPRPDSLPQADTILPWGQGQLIPADWPTEVSRPPFDGQFFTSGAYMPWIGQTNDKGQAWQMIAQTPWDGGYSFCHPAGGPTSDVAFYWLPSLGTWRYPRQTRIYLRVPGLNLLGAEAAGANSLNYNALAKRYRRYVKERGHFSGLAEKIVRNPNIKKLIGASVVHLGIKSHTQVESRFYQADQPELNDCLVTFTQRRQQMEHLMALGAPKFYLHLDGWGAPGYDNGHPDYLPVCPEAGGESGLKSLMDTVQSGGNLFGLHDQYRDYYFRAASFDLDEAVTNADGTNSQHANWAGGRQTFLCASLAGHYLKRNFAALFQAGIKPDCSYLDVFTCNEPDECFHPAHPMTRRDCLDYRLECFAYLNSQGIVPSSEEVNDWAISQLVFCHYAPHAFMLDSPGSARPGRAIPLWNLVYHDATFIPWPTDPPDDTHEDYLLYALLNAGMPYLIREGAYPGIDGAFADTAHAQEHLKQAIERAKVAAKLHRRLALTELVEHTFLSPDCTRQSCRYRDGTVVEVDFKTGSFTITPQLD